MIHKWVPIYKIVDASCNSFFFVAFFKWTRCRQFWNRLVWKPTKNKVFHRHFAGLILEHSTKYFLIELFDKKTLQLILKILMLFCFYNLQFLFLNIKLNGRIIWFFNSPVKFQRYESFVIRPSIPVLTYASCAFFYDDDKMNVRFQFQYRYWYIPNVVE